MSEEKSQKLTIIGPNFPTIHQNLVNNFKYYPGYPKEGVNFWDPFQLFKNETLFCDLVYMIDEYANTIKGKVDVVVGIESKGFIIGPLIAKQISIPFVPIRKKGKLPGKTVSETYTLEYGTDCIEIQEDSIQEEIRVLMVDDFLATGGTLAAGCNLIEKQKGNIIECFVLCTLLKLNGINNIPYPVTTIFALGEE